LEPWSITIADFSIGKSPVHSLSGVKARTALANAVDIVAGPAVMSC
jgi:hypothetical protein